MTFHHVPMMKKDFYPSIDHGAPRLERSTLHVTNSITHVNTVSSSIPKSPLVE